MINVAVIGVGSMGINHARNYSKMKGVRLVAVCDSEKESARKAARLYNTEHFYDHKKLLNKINPDAVSIAVPTSEHKDVALDFIKSGVAVLIEKPLASNSKEARVIVEKAKKGKVILAVGHVERFNPAVIKLDTMLRKGEFGDIISIVVRRVGFFPSRITDVGVVTDLAVHDIDIITSLVGKLPVSIFAKGGSSLTNGREDHAEILLDYHKYGCFIQVNWVTPIKIRKLSITGTEGYVELNYMTQQIDVLKSKYKVKQPKGFGEFVEKYGEPSKSTVRVKKEEPLKIELEDFIESVKGNKKPKVSGEDGLRAVELSEFVLKSIRSNKVIRVV